MLKRIKTESGNRWAIVFDEPHCELAEIQQMQIGLVKVLQGLTSSELYGNLGEFEYSALELLEQSFLDFYLLDDYQRHLEKAGIIED
jgi:hypothetical protein